MKGVKDSKGKARLSLVPWKALSAVAEVMAWAITPAPKGKGKPEGDWKHVEDGERLFAEAASRHLLQYFEGEEFDEESNLPHIALAATDCLIAVWHRMKKNVGISRRAD